MDKCEFINNLPELEDYEELYKLIVPSNKNGGTIQLNGEDIKYDEVSMEEFFNEEVNT